tara:strand:+ start:82 stop:378 length:297 start_codon:yes stop_codon:yes gene_type:complete
MEFRQALELPPRKVEEEGVNMVFRARLVGRVEVRGRMRERRTGARGSRVLQLTVYSLDMGIMVVMQVEQVAVEPVVVVVPVVPVVLITGVFQGLVVLV